MSERVVRPTLLVVGPLPPPRFGMSVATERVLAYGMAESCRLVHVDTSDHRTVGNVGTFDLMNVWLAMLHGARFLRALLVCRPEVVYLPIAQNTLGLLRDLLFLLPARWSHRKVVVHFHGSRFGAFLQEAPVPLSAIVRYALRRVDCVIVLADRFVEEFRPLLSTGRVVVVPNGCPQVELAADRTPPDTHVVALGNMSADKGTFVLLRALGALKGRLPSLRATLAGTWMSPGERDEGLRIVRELDLGDVVSFHGEYRESDLPSLLGSAAVLVHASFHEGQPFVLLEAMSAGVPVIATAVGGIRDTVVDNVTGVLVAPGEANALADAMARILTDEGLRRSMGQAGFRRWSESFTLDGWGMAMRSELSSALLGEVGRLQ